MVVDHPDNRITTCREPVAPDFDSVDYPLSPSTLSKLGVRSNVRVIVGLSTAAYKNEKEGCKEAKEWPRTQIAHSTHEVFGVRFFLPA